MIYAYLNHGRWVCDCPECNSAEVVDPASTDFVCREQFGGCGYRAKIQFPADLGAISDVTGVRPQVNRNWRPGETLVDLRLENAAHQLPSGLQELSS